MHKEEYYIRASKKTYSKREIKNILKNNGFVYVGSNGARDKYRRGNSMLVINEESNKIIFQRLIKEHNLIV